MRRVDFCYLNPISLQRWIICRRRSSVVKDLSLTRVRVCMVAGHKCEYSERVNEREAHYPQHFSKAEIAWRTINDWLVGCRTNLPANH